MKTIIISNYNFNARIFAIIIIAFGIVGFDFEVNAQCTGCTTTINTNTAYTFNSTGNTICITSSNYSQNVNFNWQSGPNSVCINSGVNFSGSFSNSGNTANIQLYGTISTATSLNFNSGGTLNFTIGSTGTFLGSLTSPAVGTTSVAGIFNPTSVSINSGYTLNVSSIGNATIPGSPSINGIINNSGNLVFTGTPIFNAGGSVLGGNVVFNNSMTAATFGNGGTPIIISGNVTVNGTFYNNGNVQLTSGSSLTVNGDMYINSNMTLAGSVLVTGNFLNNGNVVQSSGATSILGSATINSSFIGGGAGGCGLFCPTGNFLNNSSISAGSGLSLCKAPTSGSQSGSGVGVFVATTTSQPQNLTITATTTGNKGTFIISTSTGTNGYIVVRNAGSQPTAPTSFTSYSAGSVVSGSTIVVAVLSPRTVSSFIDIQPSTCGTTYYYAIYAYQVSTSSGTACGNNFYINTINPSLASFATSVLASASSITGSSAVCSSASSVYSIATISGATGYLWGYSGNGVFITSTTTSATLSFTSTATSGVLTVAGFSYCGTGTGSSLNLSLTSSPTIVYQPTSATVCGGNSNVFTVSATGSSLSYLWSNGATTQNITVAGAGNYTVTVSGVCGSGISNTVALSSFPSPSFTIQPTSSTICGGTNAFFTGSASGTSITYSWQLSTNSGSSWVSISNGGVYSGATTYTLSLTGISTGYSGYQYRAIASNSCSNAVTSTGANLFINVVGQWLGTVNADWSNASNWCSQPLLTTDNASISSTASIMPIITTSSVSINSINIGSGASLTIQSSNTLTLGGNFINDGSFIPNTSLVKFGGSTAQTISGTGVNLFYNININNTSGVTLGSTISVSGTMTLGTNAKYSSGSSTTVLLSTSTANTARLAALPSGATFAGNITMQRYVPPKPTLRLMSSAVNGSTLTDWQASIPITGNGSGFDASLAKITTVWYFNEAINAPTTYRYVSAPNTSMPLTVGEGYRVYVRGNRNNCCNLMLGTATPSSVVMSVTNPPNTGTISLPVTYTNYNATFRDGTNLVGNPYPSEINWDSPGWTKVNIDNAIYVWDPSLGVNGQYYSYVAGISSPNVINGGIIGSSQAFFVKASAPGTTPSLIITESVKTIVGVGNFTSSFRTSSSSPQLLRLQLWNNTSQYDETVIRFIDGATIGFDSYFDAYKMYNSNVNIYSNPVSGIDFSINSMPPISNSIVSIPLTVNSNEKGSHSIVVNNIESLNDSLAVFLLDSYLNSFNDFQENNTYNFQITSDVNSSGSSRFSLVTMRKQTLTSINGNFSNLPKPSIKVYPNPNNGTSLTIDFYNLMDSGFQLNIKDVTGTSLISKTITSGGSLTYSIEISDFGTLPSGVYFINIHTANVNLTEKVVLVK